MCLLLSLTNSEMGPLTLGYERWANLAPEVHELQSFGYAEVTEDGSELSIKLINIDGSVMFSKVLTAEEDSGSQAKDSAPSMYSLVGLVSAMIAILCSVIV